MRRSACVLLWLVLVGAGAAPALALDDTARSASLLLRRAATLQPDGSHHVMLRALRQLADPQLEPLFDHLANQESASLQIHGILGLAELQAGTLDLDLLTRADEPAVQAEVIASALESELIDLEQCQQLVRSPALDTGVRILLATRLVEHGVDVDPGVLTAARAGSNSGMAALAALLQMEQGQLEAQAHLDNLNESTALDRDSIRMMLLQTAIRHEFQSIGPWALRIARESDVRSGLRLLALRAAMRFDAADAVRAWAHRYDSSTSPADHVRLAILALDLADRLEPELFEPLLSDDQDVVRLIGRISQARAAGEQPRELMLRLLQRNHMLGSRWVLEHARRQPIEQALPLLVGVIFAAEDEPDPARFRGQRLENAVLAAQDIAERADNAEQVLTDLVRATPGLTQEAILMGLIRAEREQTHRLVAAVDEWSTDTAEALAMLLKARQGAAFAERDTRSLRLVVRGGAGIQPPLRMQAAWIYLKLTNQQQEALAEVVGR